MSMSKWFSSRNTDTDNSMPVMPLKPVMPPMSKDIFLTVLPLISETSPLKDKYYHFTINFVNCEEPI